MIQHVSSPQKLSLRKMYNAFIQIDEGRTKHLYFTDGLGIVLDAVNVLRPFIFNGQGGPYLIEDYRLVLCKKGSIRTIVNLQEIRIEEGMMAVIVPGSIIEPLSVSDDFTVTGIGVSEERMRLAHSGQLPEILFGEQKTVFLMPTEEEKYLVNQLFVVMWNLASGALVGNETIDHMLSVITHAFNDIFCNKSADTGFIANPSNRQYEMFQNFINLINEHCRSERQLEFYADRLCITKRYLGTIVREVSGVTAKEWIDRATITIAKVMLRHSNKSVTQISDELHFPNNSFFCKYFKRLTGCTPIEWRNAM